MTKRRGYFNRSEALAMPALALEDTPLTAGFARNGETHLTQES
jgi:hypothetical protein